MPVQVWEQVLAARRLAERLQHGSLVRLAPGLHVNGVLPVVRLEPIPCVAAAGERAGEHSHLAEELSPVLGQRPVEDLSVTPELVGAQVLGAVDLL